MTNSVAEASEDSARGSDKLAKVRTLRGGVEAMRAAGEKYLPKEERETDTDYDDRKSRSWLLPSLDKAVENVADQIFAKEVQLDEDVPDVIADLEVNITNDGRNLNTFAREVCEDGVEAGVSFIFVDCPRKPDEMTVAEQQAMNFRPYMTLVKAEDVLGWKTETVNNITELAQVRILETVTEDDPEDRFKQEHISQVRVLTREEGRVTVELWRQSDKSGWQLHDEFVVDIPEITLVPFYTNRTGFMTGLPPLENLADLNIAHWQSASDQRNILHTARVPLLFLKGMSADEIKSAANSALYSTADNADAKWVEHSGKAIEAGQNDLKHLEQSMAVLGLQLMMPKPGTATATGEALDTAKANTPLAMIANSLKDSLETALGYMAQYMGLDEGGSVAVNTDFGVNLLGQADLQFLLNARNTGQISHATFIKECKRRNVLMDGIDAEDEQERLEDEIPEREDLAEVDLEDETPSPQEAFLNVVNGGLA